MNYGDLSTEARELVLFSENEERIYRQEQSIYKNLDRKKAKGIFDIGKAAKLFRYETDAAAKLYTQEFGREDGRYAPIFSTKDRQEAAEFMARAYESSYRGRLDSGEAWQPKKKSSKTRSR